MRPNAAAGPRFEAKFRKPRRFKSGTPAKLPISGTALSAIIKFDVGALWAPDLGGTRNGSIDTRGSDEGKRDSFSAESCADGSSRGRRRRRLLRFQLPDGIRESSQRECR